MEEFDQVIKTASAVGAAVGGVASFVVTWGWKIWERRDSIQVRYGPSRFDDEPGYALHVVSRRDHHIDITDYGFVLRSGVFLSIPRLIADGLFEDSRDALVGRGETTLKHRNDLFERQLPSSVALGDVVAAYAKTSTQDWPRLHFRRLNRVGALRRLAIRARSQSRALNA